MSLPEVRPTIIADAKQMDALRVAASRRAYTGGIRVHQRETKPVPEDGPALTMRCKVRGRVLGCDGLGG